MSFLPVTLQQAELAQAAREGYKPLDPDFDAPVIPWPAYWAFLERTRDCWTMPGRKAHYWQTVRVMVQALQWTGCRISELDLMRPDLIFGNAAYWPIGKHQKGMRKEYVPDEFLRELDQYRAKNRVAEGRVFGVDHQTFKRYFDRDVRPSLGPLWNEQVVRVRNRELRLDYTLQLKGFRKNFQTILFKKQWDKYGDPAVALEFVSKRMRHSSKQMTAYHYIQNFDALDVNEWLTYWAGASVAATTQARLADFVESIEI